MSNNPLKNIPSVHEILESPSLRHVINRVNRNVVVQEVRSFLDNLRSEVHTKTTDIRIPAPGELAERIAQWILSDQQPRLRPVINATGIILHTGLGRAPLANDAINEVAAIAGGYASLEIDLDSGNRSQRAKSVEKLLIELTGAQAALVVNNNAGATLLTLAALAADQEVVVSRGQLIEIGGSYRLPDVMSQSGCALREVGTTNKTRIADFATACGEQTGALLRVHTSNYVIEGFTEQPSLPQLVELAKEHSVPLVDDIGSGALVDFSKYGLAGEPVARDSIEAGADVVLFSGDKLLGGPQCGIIVGKQEIVEKIGAHPLTRALRVGKLTLAALAATLRLYRDTEVAEHSVPLLSMISTSEENLRNRAERLTTQLTNAKVVADAEPLRDITYLGGGSVPTQQLVTWCVAITVPGQGTNNLARALRTTSPAVFGRVQQDRLLLDLRGVLPRQDAEIVTAFATLDDTDETRSTNGQLGEVSLD